MNELKTKIGIVTTVADAADHMEFFLEYHRSIGIFHIFVFIDDLCEKTYRIVKRLPYATPFYVDETLKDQWKSIAHFQNIEKRCLVDSEVMVRQELNVGMAYIAAKELDIDWLLHIDIDELFYPNGVDLDDHYLKMKKNNVGSCIYTNYEAIPFNENSESIYTATPYFKKNYFKKGHWFFSEAQREFLDKCNWLSKFYFNYYQNGKSAANIHYDLNIQDVHAMWVNDKKMEFLSHDDPLILHFPSITLKEFTKKYKRLGNFDSYWKGFPRAGMFIDTLHLDARDAYQIDPEGLFKQLFRSKILLDKENIKNLIENDLAVKIDIIDPSKTKQSLTDTKKNVAKPNMLYEKRMSFIDLIRAELKAEWKINFGSLSEARIWLRRHPELARESECFIPLNAPYSPYLRDEPLYDLHAIKSGTAHTEPLFKNPSPDQAFTISIDALMCIRNTENLTELDLFIKKLGFLKEICQRESCFYNLFFEVPSGREQHLLRLPNLNIVNYQLIKFIEIALLNKAPESLTNHLINNYPKSSFVNWGISIGNSNLLTVTQHKKVAFSITCAIGGTILTNKESEIFLQEFIDARNKFPFIVDIYAELLISKNHEAILLHKANNKQHFISISNFTDNFVTIDTNDLPVNLVNCRCINLIKNEALYFSERTIQLSPYEYLWLLITDED